MRIFRTPRIVISRCIEGDPVRYNGEIIRSSIVKVLKQFAEFIPICPEIEIGLGVPRDPLRIVRINGGDHLIQPATERDLTDEMRNFSASFLDSLPSVEGFILKNRSPTSGMKDAKVYPSPKSSAPIERTAGFFGRAVLERFPHLPIEDEGRLRNVQIRDHFLTRIFALADFRTIQGLGTLEGLVEFHTQNKYLLMAHNQKRQQKMGRIIANHAHMPVDEVIGRYQLELLEILFRAPRYTTNVNVLLHALGHFSHRLSEKEKAFFLDALGRYHAGKISICAPKNIIKAWIIRFEDPVLDRQTFFAPYPDELMELEPAETDRGRDYWSDQGAFTKDRLR
jgi:uncharacterized protein YbgA (DUF1722 family)/uncharacterized protein YbbK (DUF523 family)